MRPDLERLLEASYRTVGRDLRTDAGGDPYDAPAALLMQGTQADPVFCYANRTVQGLWGLAWTSAAAPSRAQAQSWHGGRRNLAAAKMARCRNCPG
jgi:hypothetical protein